ncbi:MAG: hypothetical protein OCD76_19340 [Reichenbachiella sp.]
MKLHVLSITLCFITSVFAGFAPGSRTLIKIADKSQIPELNTQHSERGSEVWDLEEHRGKIYIGMGDYGDNTGPIDIVYYDPATNSLHTAYSNAPTEATEYIRSINGNLYVMMTDHQGYYGAAFLGLSEGTNTWHTSGHLTSTAHTYDITEFNGQLYVSTGDWSTSSPGPRVPANETARVYTSVDGGANWQLDLAAPHARFYHIGSDATTLFANGNNANYYKENGLWTQLFDTDNYRPVTVNGIMRMLPALDGENVYTLSQGSIIKAEPKPFYADNFFANNVSPIDDDLDHELFWMLGTPNGSNAMELYVTKDFIEWTPIVTLSDQGTNSELYKTFKRLAYYDNTLYFGTTEGHLYALQEIFDFNAPLIKPELTIISHSVGEETDSFNDLDGSIEPGESLSGTVTIKNIGDIDIYTIIITVTPDRPLFISPNEQTVDTLLSQESTTLHFSMIADTVLETSLLPIFISIDYGDSTIVDTLFASIEPNNDLSSSTYTSSDQSSSELWSSELALSSSKNSSSSDALDTEYSEATEEPYSSENELTSIRIPNNQPLTIHSESNGSYSVHLPLVAEYTIILYTLNGKKILSHTETTGTVSLTIPQEKSGIFIVRIEAHNFEGTGLVYQR